MSGRGVFLDRDGVLVRTVVRDNRAYAPCHEAEFHIEDGAGREVSRLRAAGLVPIVFTNQPEVARGALPRDALERMHARLRAEVPVADVFVCPHDGDDGCDCRKPRPGLLRAAAEKWRLELARSFVVGDRWRDIDAGRAVGCYSVLIDRPYSACARADARVATLAEAVDVILARLRG